MKEAAATAAACLVLLFFSVGYHTDPTELPTLSLPAPNETLCGSDAYFTVWEWCSKSCAPDPVFEAALARVLRPVLPNVTIGGCACGDTLCVGAWLAPARRVEIVVAMAGTIAAATNNASAREAVRVAAGALSTVPWHARLTREQVAILAVSQSPHYPESCKSIFFQSSD
ncbi:MAG: hypothetical protein VW491_11365 [Gammaproteobacteria bacterium]